MNDYLDREVTVNSVPGVAEFKLEPGVTLAGRYRLRAFLGEGGMGRVWHADEHDGYGKVQEVVVKIVPPEVQADAGEMRQIRHSFDLVRRLRHPNLTTPLTLAYDAGHGVLLILDFIDGESLSRYQKTRPDGKFTLAETVEMLRPLAAALDYAHEQGIIHRDIKPQNVMVPYLARTTRHKEVKLIDFDLAAEVFTTMDDVSKQVTATSGTIPYMPPEQLQGQIQGPRSDQYSLAVMAYKMLSGELPFAAPAHHVLTYQIINQSPRSLSGVPDFANQAVMKAMHKMREGRYDTCGEFVAALAGQTAPRLTSPDYEIPEYAAVAGEVPVMSAAARVAEDGNGYGRETPVLEMPEPAARLSPFPSSQNQARTYPEMGSSQTVSGSPAYAPGMRKPLSEVTSTDNMDQYLFLNPHQNGDGATAVEREMWGQQAQPHRKPYTKVKGEEGMDFDRCWKLYLRCWQNCTDMHSRASKEEFWSYTAFHYAILIGGGIFFAPLALLYWIASLLPSLTVTVRRLNDCDVPSGLTFLLIVLTPLVFPCFIVLYMMFHEGSRGVNSHGAPPE